MNDQPIERPSHRDGIEVRSIWQTIQGEGPSAGMPAAFLRLAGCNLQCPLCDTDYTSIREMMSVEEVVDRIGRIRFDGLVVLTGGEPFRQNIGPLVKALVFKGYQVEIETNGTFYRSDLPYWQRDLTIICSPKTKIIHPKIVDHVGAYKYVIQAGHVNEKDGLPTNALGGSYEVARPPVEGGFDVFIQPLDEKSESKNQANLAAALDSCTRFGYRLCLQIHKIVGLD